MTGALCSRNLNGRKSTLSKIAAIAVLRELFDESLSYTERELDSVQTEHHMCPNTDAHLINMQITIILWILTLDSSYTQLTLFNHRTATYSSTLFS